MRRWGIEGGNRFGRSHAAVLLLAVLLAGCNSAMLTRDGPSAAIVSPPTVNESAGTPIAAAEHARIVAAYGGIYHDQKLERSIAEIVGRLVAASDRPTQRYHLTILNAPAINAFALPDGYIYVTRGLIALANDASEFAAVVAHEMAHVTANHAAERQNRARTAAVVSNAVKDVLNDEDASRLALVSSQRTLATFSRQQELEADALGVRIASRAGYDPYAASRFLNQMAEFARYRDSLSLRPNKGPDFLATHPSTPERISFARRAAEETGIGGGATDRDAYLSAVESILFGDDTAQGYVRGRNFLHAGLGVGFAVPEGFVIDNTNDAVLATGADGTALRFDGVNLSPNVRLEDYLASGWINGLDRSSIKPVTVGGLEAATASAQAKDWVFRITVIRVGESATYRFIFANEKLTPGFVTAADAIAGSFRKLDPREVAGLKPLRLHIVRVRPGDTSRTLARRMSGVERPQELFQVLNGLGPNDNPRPGSLVKIVSD